MTHTLLTGMSGTGKTTLLEELARRSHHTIDTDYSYPAQRSSWTPGVLLWSLRTRSKR